MTNPTAHDAAGVSQETAVVIAELESLRNNLENEPWGHGFDISAAESVVSAIDRMIVLDHAAHPRERALRQDAKRGNFRQEDDGA